MSGMKRPDAPAGRLSLPQSENARCALLCHRSSDLDRAELPVQRGARAPCCARVATKRLWMQRGHPLSPPAATLLVAGLHVAVVATEGVAGVWHCRTQPTGIVRPVDSLYRHWTYQGPPTFSPLPLRFC
jgi:hypothetical protein